MPRKSGHVEINAENLWASIDVIAKQRDMTLPQLALHAGLDQSTFSHGRRLRNWISLRTLAKLLNVYEISIVDWARMVEEVSDT